MIREVVVVFEVVVVVFIPDWLVLVLVIASLE
jgi:hypothetical protein